MLTAAEVFEELAVLPRWVPYRLNWNVKREKFDKIPYSGSRGLSTKAPTDWTELVEAATRAKEYALPGIGFVMTGGIEYAGWRLLGLDFDDVDFENFEYPLATYAEKSPSGTGMRSFAWVPADWAIRYKDTLSAHPTHCKHAEIYVGTSPRFLTVTFDPINDYPIAQLKGATLAWLEQWMQPADSDQPVVPVPEHVGCPVDFSHVPLSQEQKELIEGRGKLDRSNVLHGLIIKLIDSNISQEDVLATILATPALWQYCLSHRHDNAARAAQFAKEEITRGYSQSTTAKRDRLIGYSPTWKQEPQHKEEEVSEEDLLFPSELVEKAPGLVGEVMRWIMKASYSPREEFAYASALSMVACLIGPYCTQGTRDGKMNLYITLVGETGTGKNEAIDTMGLLLGATDAKDCVQDFPASEAALRRQLNVTPNILLRIDELAHKLESMKNSSNGSSLGRAILEAYNGARMPPKVYADEKKSLPAVENPFVQILGGTTDKIWDTVKSSHMEDGTLNRFIFVCLPENTPYSRNLEPKSDVSKELKDKLNAFWRDGRRYDLLGDVPNIIGRKVRLSDPVKQAVDELDHAVWELQQQEYGSLYTRFVQNSLKVAAVLAVGDGRYEITADDFEMARKFIKWSIANTYHKINMRMADSIFERNTKRLLEKLKKETYKRMSMRDAYRFMHLTRREMEELTMTLVLSGDIEITKDSEAEYICLMQ